MNRHDRISAWLDGALSSEDEKTLVRESTRDPDLAQDMKALADQDAELIAAFDLLLDPSAEIAADPTPVAANLPRAPRLTGGLLAAGLALILIGMGGGAYLTHQIATPQVIVQAPGWMEAIASYHRVYARQTRHLVEVPANETPHIEAWLTKETGAKIKVPDLAASGFAFQGARLLVAADKPVAQLIYTDAGGKVLALCALQSDKQADGFETKLFDGVEMVRWTEPGAAWVAVGDPGMKLRAAAERAAAEI